MNAITMLSLNRCYGRFAKRKLVFMHYSNNNAGIVKVFISV
jgi:hypothetical protein